MQRVVLLSILLLVPSMSGCLQEAQDGFDRLLAPRADVTITQLTEGGWNRDGHFGVKIIHARALSGAIELTNRLTDESITHQTPASDAVDSGDGRLQTDVEAIIPDGQWDILVTVDDHNWLRLYDVRIDSVAPDITGLESNGNAPDGTYVLGQEAAFTDGTLEVLDSDGTILGTDFPVTITGLGDGIHIIQVVATDQAGNRNVQLVQIIAGKATDLPRGEATFGIISRYTIQAELWDLARARDYLSPAEAQQEAPEYLGSGHGITPDDPVVQAVVDDVVAPSMSTMEVAWALYEWMFDELEYDDERLVSSTLMLPRHVITDSEDPDAEADPSQDEDDDGLSDDGPGNGVKGGVCRDLAGTYVSLLRAAGVPARLVTGYLAGTVNGFHAWVEIYVGKLGGQPGWMPVDVSPMDGQWDDEFGIGERGPAVAMQAFGIRLPEYLPLRPLETDEEIQGWSTAIKANYAYSPTVDPPELEFLRKTVDAFVEEQVMCVDSVTFARQFASTPSDCEFGDAVYGWDASDQEATFITAAVQIIDYGVIVENAKEASVSMEVAYPFEEELGPVTVEFEPYAPKEVSYKTTDDGYVSATIDYE